MNTYKVFQSQFALIEAEWTVKKARQLLQNLIVSYVIVHENNAQDEYHMLTSFEALTRLNQGKDQAQVKACFN
jgi:hypothetical protein